LIQNLKKIDEKCSYFAVCTAVDGECQRRGGEEFEEVWQQLLECL
jgi:hypothetical protein